MQMDATGPTNIGGIQLTPEVLAQMQGVDGPFGSAASVGIVPGEAPFGGLGVVGAMSGAIGGVGVGHVGHVGAMASATAPAVVPMAATAPATTHVAAAPAVVPTVAATAGLVGMDKGALVSPSLGTIPSAVPPNPAGLGAAEVPVSAIQAPSVAAAAAAAQAPMVANEQITGKQVLITARTVCGGFSACQLQSTSAAHLCFRPFRRLKWSRDTSNGAWQST